MKLEQTYLFELEKESKTEIINIASVPQRSPFRYAGGKTWFIPRLREWLKSQFYTPKVLVEPFLGGGIVSLTAVCEKLVDSAVMVELDDDVAAVWSVITTGDAEWLADRILKFEMNHENAVTEISKPARITRDKAFRTILKNRCLHGGILAAGAGFLKKGEAGKGVLSRWYPETLAKRLREIDLVHSKLEFKHADAFDILDEYRQRKDAVFFIDPPYTAGGKKAGKRLYTHYEVDHDLLFRKCASLKGDFIMTYDNSKEVGYLAEKYNLQIKPIAMKNTHHAKLTEFVIGRNLDWMIGINRVLEKQAEYKAQKVK